MLNLDAELAENLKVYSDYTKSRTAVNYPAKMDVPMVWDRYLDTARPVGDGLSTGRPRTRPPCRTMRPRGLRTPPPHRWGGGSPARGRAACSGSSTTASKPRPGATRTRSPTKWRTSHEQDAVWGVRFPAQSPADRTELYRGPRAAGLPRLRRGGAGARPRCRVARCEGEVFAPTPEGAAAKLAEISAACTGGGFALLYLPAGGSFEAAVSRFAYTAQGDGRVLTYTLEFVERAAQREVGAWPN